MGAVSTPPPRMTFEEGLDTARRVWARALTLLERLEAAGFARGDGVLNALWQLHWDADDRMEFICVVMEGPQFNDIGIFVTDHGEWWHLVDIEASCPRVFLPPVRS